MVSVVSPLQNVSNQLNTREAKAFGSTAVKSVSLGERYSCALTPSGGVKCWGDAPTFSTDGNPTAGPYSTSPVDVVTSATNSAPLSGISAISAGHGHACALTTSGGVKCWGVNASGQLGDKTTTPREAPVDVVSSSTNSAPLSGIAAISAGSSHTCALTTGGGVKCWGGNQNGQLGIGTVGSTNYPEPVDVPGLSSGVSAIAVGSAFSCALLTTGGVKCWGINREGQVGNGVVAGLTAPTADDNVASPSDVRTSSSDSTPLTGVSALAVGSWHTCALLTTGTMKCWGKNEFGQLGDRTKTDSGSPVDVSGLSGVTGIATAMHSTCAVIGGGVKCWGRNADGELGNNKPATSDGFTSSTPVDVHTSPTNSAPLSGVSAVAGGAYHYCALMTTGELKCWGSAVNGELGRGVTFTGFRPTPDFVKDGATNFVAYSTSAPSASAAASINDTTPLLGETLTGTATFTGSPTPTKTSQWYRCTSPAASTSTSIPGDCTPISGATGSTYALTAADVGSYIRYAETATNNQGSATSLSAAATAVGMSATGAPDLATSSDLGNSSSDNLTSDSTPRIDLTGLISGASVTVTATKSGSTPVTCTFTASGTTGGCDLGTLSDGTWAVSATQTASGQTSAASTSLNVNVDTTAPTAPGAPDLASASDLGTSNSDNITSDTTPTMSISSGGSNGDVVTMSATKGSTTVSCTYTIGTGTQSCDLPTLSAGLWTTSATLTDAAGNVSSAGTSLGVTIVAPPATPSAPDLAAASDTGSSSTDNITNDTTPTVSAAGGNAGDTVTLSATNGATTTTCSYVLPATSCDLPTLTQGTWSITAAITDPYGNVSATSPATSISVDTAAPTAPGAPDLAAASDTGTSNTDNNTTDTTPTMSISSGGNNGDVVTMSATNGTTTLSCTYTIGTGTQSCDLPTLSTGSWTVSATLTDPAGNTSAASTTLPLSIVALPTTPSNAPDLVSASDTGASSTDNITSDTTPTLTGSGGTTGQTVTISATKDGVTKTCSYVIGTGTQSCDLSALTDGSWSVTSTITDALGNVSSPSPALNLVVDTTAPAAPATAPDLLAASDLGISSTDNITSDTTPAIGLPGVSDGNLVSITAKKADGTTVSCSYTKSATISSCDLQTLTDGNWSVSATVTDVAGNKSTTSPSLDLVIDTTPPTPPAAPTVPTNAANQTADPTPTLAVDGVTPGETITGTATNGNKSLSCVFVGAPGVRSCTLPLLTPGQWFISATVTDPAGNTSLASPQTKVEVVKTGLPANASSLASVSMSGTKGDVTATATLKPSELGKVANVVFVVKNTNGKIVRTVRMPAPLRSTSVSAVLKGLTKGQRVSAYTENWLGVSKSAPRGANVIRAATVKTYDNEGRPNLIGKKVLESRVIFDPASPLLDTSDKMHLDRIARKISNKGGLLLISGFARQNQVDTKTFLKDLSVERAKAVANYLSARGVRAWIRYQGYGAITQKLGGWEDRKVEIRWVSGASELPTK
jgi:alpha-tubulin suppressor-like RCC1 family protein/outer membrane protein OmpA-like peptidoglycan-associated protein